MRKLTLIVCLALVCATVGVAQQAPSDVPATKEDIQRLFEVMHSREMTTKMLDAMLKPMHEMIHEQFLKSKDQLPPDFEARMNKMIDDMMRSFPLDQMLDAMVPVYQKHLTRADVNAMIVFYGSPTGQKLLTDMPAIMAEAMQSMMPILQKQVDAMNQRVQQEVAEMIKQYGNKPGTKPQPTTN
jgi:uncharacterized protein